MPGAILAANFLVPNGTFIVELIAFALLLWAINRWIVPPVNKALTERQATIRAALADAEEAKRRSEEAEAEYRRAIDEARAEARRLIDEARQYTEQERADAQSRAQQDYRQIIDRADADIQASARRAAEDLRQQVSTLVVTVVEKVVGEGFDAAQHRALIDRTIAEVEREAGASEVNA